MTANDGSIRTNLEWEAAVCDMLSSIPARYLNGDALNREESAILTMAMATVGSPPEKAVDWDSANELPFMIFELPPPDTGNSGGLH